MSFRVTATVDSGQSLERIERLLDRALGDLKGTGSSAPGMRCGAILAEAFSELQQFSVFLRNERSNRSSLLPRVKSLLPRLKAAERLLEASAEFYRGWCAVGPPPAYPAPDYYPSDQLAHSPALLALEG